MILAERAARLSAEAEARAEGTNADAMIAHLRLEIEKLRRALYGVRSERRSPASIWTYVRDDRPFSGAAPPAADELVR
jgi:hypothetical protein